MNGGSGLFVDGLLLDTLLGRDRNRDVNRGSSSRFNRLFIAAEADGGMATWRSMKSRGTSGDVEVSGGENRRHANDYRS